MLFSIITVTRNSLQSLTRTLESVDQQTFQDYEHIVIDGASTDGTPDYLQGFAVTHPRMHFISEPDQGIYDAINKGIQMAKGEIIALVHADDFYADKYVLQRYAHAFSIHPVDAIYANLVYVGSKQILPPPTPSGYRRRIYEPFSQRNGRARPAYQHMGFSIPWMRIYQYLSSRHFINGYPIIRNWITHTDQRPHASRLHSALLHGWMPPHPTLFIRKEVFVRYGLYLTHLRIASDYEMIIRLFLQHQISSYYLPVTTYCMTVGGHSNRSLKNILQKSREDLEVMRAYHFPHPVRSLIWKNLSKLPQFLNR